MKWIFKNDVNSWLCTEISGSCDTGKRYGVLEISLPSEQSRIPRGKSVVSLCLAGYLVFSFLHRREACSVLASSAGHWVLIERDAGGLLRSAPRRVSGRALCLSAAWLLPPRVRPSRTPLDKSMLAPGPQTKGTFWSSVSDCVPSP